MQGGIGGQRAAHATARRGSAWQSPDASDALAHVPLTRPSLTVSTSIAHPSLLVSLCSSRRCCVFCPPSSLVLFSVSHCVCAALVNQSSVIAPSLIPLFPMRLSWAVGAPTRMGTGAERGLGWAGLGCDIGGVREQGSDVLPQRRPSETCPLDLLLIGRWGPSVQVWTTNISHNKYISTGTST